MAEHVIKLPDVGEGVAEAELVEWHAKVGDLVPGPVLAAVMTDKATVEIPRRSMARSSGWAPNRHRGRWRTARPAQHRR